MDRVRGMHLMCGMVVMAVAGRFALGEFIGVNWSGDVFSLDATGSGFLVGPSAFTNLNSLAQDSTGKLVTINDAISGTPRIIEIDPMTGAGTIFHIPFLNDVRALAFSPGDDDILYAADGSGGVRDLYALDLSVPFGDSSIKTLIGRLNFGDIQGMVFGSDGVLYGWGTSQGLVTIDPKTALAVDINDEFDGSSAIQTLAFTPDGTLYGVGDELFTIDLMTGERNLVGSDGFTDVRGFAWIPQPSVMALFFVAALGQGGRRRRRR